MDPPGGEIPNAQAAGGRDAISRQVSLVDYLLLVYFSKKSSADTVKKPY